MDVTQKEIFDSQVSDILLRHVKAFVSEWSAISSKAAAAGAFRSGRTLLQLSMLAETNLEHVTNAALKFALDFAAHERLFRKEIVELTEAELKDYKNALCNRLREIQKTIGQEFIWEELDPVLNHLISSRTKQALGGWINGEKILEKDVPSSENIFIGWSGEYSRSFAIALLEWLPLLFSNISPLMSPELEKGKAWFENLTKYIASSRLSIFCLTKENLEEPWIHFEAGLAYGAGKCSDHIVCPILTEEEIEEVKLPLSAFQLTQYEEKDFLRLIKTINRCLYSPISEETVEKLFKEKWPMLKEKIDKIKPASVYEERGLLTIL